MRPEYLEYQFWDTLQVGLFRSFICHGRCLSSLRWDLEQLSSFYSKKKVVTVGCTYVCACVHSGSLRGQDHCQSEPRETLFVSWNSNLLDLLVGLIFIFTLPFSAYYLPVRRRLPTTVEACYLDRLRSPLTVASESPAATPGGVRPFQTLMQIEK